ncbi:MAG: hypothetical protein K5839_03355 [Treponemataceae bacterium]|nr:hypothetical protein [Treponemataceae bacterium]
MERSKVIFGNEISKADYKKAVKNQKKFLRKFGDDRNTEYKLTLVDNPVLSGPLGVKTIVIDHEGKDKPFAQQLAELPSKPIIIGNIRMGFGHYRISMAMASAAHALGYTPLWFDLNSFPETTCTKIISAQNDLYSLGSRLSQKSKLFNKYVWEPINYEGFKKLSYNSSDQKVSEIMTSIFRQIPKDIPLIGTHAWPSQVAVHAGLTKVVNAIPDNWPMALHLAEGSLHTVQTHNTYFGYRTLHGFAGDKVLNPMSDKDIMFTGQYIDDELVKNIEKDCKARIARAKDGKPIRFLITVGGAGAQGEFFAQIVKTLLPYVKENKACIYLNCGDYIKVLDKIVADTGIANIVKKHVDDWEDASQLALAGCGEKSKYSAEEAGSGIHAFCNKDIFAAVYLTNLLMRSSDVIVTKPSELAYYPIPKLFIKRIGGHEMWGAIHSANLGDGTQECDTVNFACATAKSFIDNPNVLIRMCECIIENNKNEIYNGAYKTVKAAIAR